MFSRLIFARRASVRAVVALTALVAVAALGGCGGGTGGSSGGAKTAANGSSSEPAEAKANEGGAKTAEGTGAGGEEGEGGGSSEAGNGAVEGTEPAPRSGAEAKFIKEADAICAKADADIRPPIDRYARKSLTLLGKHAGEIVSEVLAPRLEQEIREVRALEVPAGAEADLEAVLESTQHMIDEARANPSKVVVEPHVLAGSERIAKLHGFSKCGGY